MLRNTGSDFNILIAVFYAYDNFCIQRLIPANSLTNVLKKDKIIRGIIDKMKIGQFHSQNGRTIIVRQ